MGIKAIYGVSAVIVGIMAVFGQRTSPPVERIEGSVHTVLRVRVGNWWECDVFFTDGRPVKFWDRNGEVKIARGRKVAIVRTLGAWELKAFEDNGQGEVMVSPAPWWNPEKE